MAVEPIIRGVDAHKGYNSGPVTVHALRGVSLTIPRGEMVAIMGPSGRRKTTLLNCFSGLESETSPQIMDLLVRLKREAGQTVVLVTHDALVSSRAHRILRMRSGQIVEETETRGG